MAVDTITERTLFDALAELGADEQWRSELELMRPSSLGRRHDLDEQAAKDAQQLGSAILSRKAKSDLERATVTILARRYMGDFLQRLVDELYVPIHRILCSRFSQSSLTGTALVGAQIAALSQMLIDHLNVSSVMAIGLATLLVVGIIRSFQGTFCKFSKEQVIDKYKTKRKGTR
jgi:hypothetical protein